MLHTRQLLLFVLIVTIYAYNSVTKGEQLIGLVNAYQNALKNNPDDKWTYMADTVKQWFDDKNGAPTLLIKGKPSAGKWREWDEVMHTVSGYDSLRYDDNQNVVKGNFFENNDFYALIGKSPTKTVRTFWFNSDNKIDEILIYWIPAENKLTSEYLIPIVEWAKKNDAAEIAELYPNGTIIPSKENAIRWKKLLARYRAEFPLQQ